METGLIISEDIAIDWKKVQSVNFSCDEVIDAYNIGVRDGKNSYRNDFIKDMKQKMSIINELTEELLNNLYSLNLKPNDIHLKIEKTNNDFYLMIELSDSYFEDYNLLLKLYKEFGDIRQKYNKDNFNINISLLPQTEHTNYEKIFSDGYFLKYAKTHSLRTGKT